MRDWYSPRATDEHWLSLICVPIRVGQCVVSVLCIDSTKQDAFGAIDWAEMEVCAGLLGGHHLAGFFHQIHQALEAANKNNQINQ